MADSETAPKARNGRRLALLIVLVLAIPIVPFAVIGELPGETWLDASGGNAFLFGLTGGGLLAADVLAPVPSTIVGTLLGARLGLVPGWLWGWGGLVVGNLVGYGLGRVALSRLVRDLPEAPTIAILVLSRPVPVLAEAMTFAAGAGRMSPAAFLLATVPANGLFAGALAANGAALLPDAWAGPGLILPLALPVVAWLAWRRFGRRTGT